MNMLMAKHERASRPGSPADRISFTALYLVESERYAMSGPAQSPPTLRFGSFELDLTSGELHKDGQKLALPPKAFAVLKALVERPGEVVTREELRTKLWPADTFVEFDDSLNHAVKKLRQALGDSADRSSVHRNPASIWLPLHRAQSRRTDRKCVGA